MEESSDIAQTKTMVEKDTMDLASHNKLQHENYNNFLNTRKIKYNVTVTIKCK